MACIQDPACIDSAIKEDLTNNDKADSDGWRTKRGSSIKEKAKFLESKLHAQKTVPKPGHMSSADNSPYVSQHIKEQAHCSTHDTEETHSQEVKNSLSEEVSKNSSLGLYNTYYVQCSNQRGMKITVFASIFTMMYSLLHIKSLGTETSTIRANVGPPPMRSHDIITTRWLPEDKSRRKYVRHIISRMFELRSH